MDKFKEKLRNAFQHLFESEDCTAVIRRFYAAYKYRAGFSWCSESGMTVGGGPKGLASAITQALAGYFPGYASSRDQGIPVQAIDDVFQREVLDALPQVDKLTLRFFRDTLQRWKTDPNTIDVKTLSQEVATAFGRYYDRVYIGSIIDPCS